MIIKGGGRHTCQRGETFDSMALGCYGDEEYAKDVLAANPEYVCLMRFRGGEVVYMPPIQFPDPDEDGAENYMPAVAPWKS